MQRKCFLNIFFYSARSSVKVIWTSKLNLNVRKMLGECSIWRLWKDRDYANVLWRLFERQNLS